IVRGFPNRSIGASPSGKAVDFDSTIRRFESSRPSQAVTQPQIVGFEIQEVPANGRLLQIYFLSLYSKFAQSPSEIADSLWLVIEIFPFLGDAGWRPGSISTLGGVGRSLPRRFLARLNGCCRALRTREVI